MEFTCEKCGWWADINGVCICGYSGRPTTRRDSCMAWKTSIVTNADRIRSMSDEELADWFYRIQYDVSDYYCGGHSCEPTLPTGKESWLCWLKQEASE